MAERMVGRPAPDFSMETALGDGKDFGTATLSDYKGKWLVLFFYPLDFTFVCPTEITALSEAADVFKLVLWLGVAVSQTLSTPREGSVVTSFLPSGEIVTTLPQV